MMLNLASWKPCPPLAAPTVTGNFIRIDPFSEQDVQSLWIALGGSSEKVNERLKYFFWFGDSPFDSPQDLGDMLGSIEQRDGWCVNVFRLIPSN